jgi:hypothetical protein
LQRDVLPGVPWRLAEGQHHELRLSENIPVADAVEAAFSPAAQAAERQLVRAYECGLRWTEPTEQGAAWMLEVLDADGTVIDSGMGDDPEEALLEVAERLLPPEKG